MMDPVVVVVVVVVVAAALATWLVLELAIYALAAWLKSGCPWILLPRDLNPPIDPAGLERFLEHGWDPELGWIRKPDTSHEETGKGGAPTRYRIDPQGSRVDPAFPDGPRAAMAYGDSYAFCRQVNDDQTWPHFLGGRLGGRVENRGVGNYGLDQALRRCEREKESASLIVMCVVPETISRVLGRWKHFSEYGNTFAFKPRYALDAEGSLTFLSNPAPTPEDFRRIPEMLADLQRTDPFYEMKFRPDLLSFPFVWALWRSRRRNLPLLAAALADRVAGGSRAFMQVMRRNLSLASNLYRDPDSLALMTAIARRFSDVAAAQGGRPVLVMIPQLLDLERLRAGDTYYRPFLERASAFMTVVDAGPMLATAEDDAALYIEDGYGGHLSEQGNRMIADLVADRLAETRKIEGVA